MRIILMMALVTIFVVMFNGCTAKKFTTITGPVVPKSPGYYVDYGNGLEKYEDILKKYPGVRKAYYEYPCYKNKAIFNNIIPVYGNTIRVAQRLTPSEQQLSGLMAFVAGGPIGGLKYDTDRDDIKCFDEVAIQPIEDMSNYKEGYTLFTYDLGQSYDLYIVCLSTGMTKEDTKVLLFRKM